MRARGKQGKPQSRDARPKGPTPWLPWAEWGLWVLLAGTALFLHVTFFTHVGALWRDEVHSVQMASLPSVSSTFEALRYDSFPVLSTLVLRGWIHAGLGSDHSLRVFGFLLGAVLLGALWCTSRLLGNPLPLISWALVGLNPWVVRTTDSIRPYGLGVALIVVTLGCVWKAVETSRPRWFVLAGLLAVLSVQCMYQNAFLLLAICLGGVVVSLRESRVRAAVGVVLVGLSAAVSLVPYLPSIAEAQSWGVLVRKPISMHRLFDVFFQTLGSGSVAALWLWLGLAVLSVAVCLHALIGRGRQRDARARSDLALYGATVLVTATAVYLTAMKATQLLTEPWYYVPLAVLIAPTLDAAVWLAATTQGRRAARLAVVFGIACAVVIPAWRELQKRWTNIDVVATRVGERATAGDLVVLNPFWIGITFQRYYKGPATSLTVPPLDVHIVRFDLFKEAMTRPNPMDPVLEAMAKALRSGHRVWWVQGMAGDESGPPPVLPPAPLSDSGWYMGPYLLGWARQAAYQLESHGQHAEVPDTRPGGGVLPYENVSLTVVSGWQ